MPSRSAGCVGWWTCGACLVVVCLAGHAMAAEPVIRFAVITDYGMNNQPEADVAALVKGRNPDFIMTAGDNNQGCGWGGTPECIDDNIGKYYADYIGNYHGVYGPGSPTNRFFPAIGNHDYNSEDGYSAHTDYFTLPGNERYYDFAAGPARFFVLNAAGIYGAEPDGISPTSVQAAWLRDTMGASASPWNFVILHDSPYTSSERHGSNPTVHWDYGPWGADAVLSGHCHIYERLEVAGLTYFVAGVGGDSLAGFGPAIPGSVVRYAGDYGAMLVEVGTTVARFRFYTRTGLVMDDFTLPVTGGKWLPAGSGSYDEALNWARGHVPNAVDAVANFLDNSSGTVTVYSPVTLGTLNLAGAGGYTLAGPAPVTLQASEGWPYAGKAQVSVLGGSHAILAPLIMAGDTRIDVQAGTLTLANHTTVQAGAVLAVTGTGLAIDTEAGGTLDLGTGSLIVDYDAGAGPLTQVADWLRAGLNAAGGGYWDGPGIVSSDAAGQADRLTAVGILDNGDPKVGGKETFAGEAVDATSILVRYTWWGDANLDGVIDANDYDVIDKGFLFTPETMGWWTGDFNYDGMIDANDYDRIDKAFLFQTGPLGDPEPAAAPEPATILLLALGALAATAVRRRS